MSVNDTFDLFDDEKPMIHCVSLRSQYIPGTHALADLVKKKYDEEWRVDRPK